MAVLVEDVPSPRNALAVYRLASWSQDDLIEYLLTAHWDCCASVMARLKESGDREFLRGLSNRVLELGGESGTEAEPHVYLGSYVEYVERTGHEAPGVHA